MRKRKYQGNLRYNGQFIETRIGLLEHTLNKKLMRSLKGNEPKDKMKYIEELKRHQTIWENLWKYLQNQIKIKQNKKNREEINASIKNCEKNFEIIDNLIQKQQKLLIKQLRE